MGTPDADPLTAAELDALDALNCARTPGPLRPFAVDIIAGGAWLILNPPTDDASNRDNDAAVMVAAANALPALLAEVRAARLAAVEVRAVATALALHEPCMACGCEDQEDSCLYHESHELSARLLAAVGVSK